MGRMKKENGGEKPIPVMDVEKSQPWKFGPEVIGWEGGNRAMETEARGKTRRLRAKANLGESKWGGGCDTLESGRLGGGGKIRKRRKKRWGQQI